MKATTSLCLLVTIVWLLVSVLFAEKSRLQMMQGALLGLNSLKSTMRNVCAPVYWINMYLTV